MQHDNGYWFPAKRYGWGWGMPATWQGWLVFLGFLVLLAVGVAVIPRHSPIGFIAYAVALSALFIAVCWWKGEPPRWRWGDE